MTDTKLPAAHVVSYWCISWIWERCPDTPQTVSRLFHRRSREGEAVDGRVSFKLWEIPANSLSLDGWGNLGCKMWLFMLKKVFVKPKEIKVSMSYVTGDIIYNILCWYIIQISTLIMQEKKHTHSDPFIFCRAAALRCTLSENRAFHWGRQMKNLLCSDWSAASGIDCQTLLLAERLLAQCFVCTLHIDNRHVTDVKDARKWSFQDKTKDKICLPGCTSFSVNITFCNFDNVAITL